MTKKEAQERIVHLREAIDRYRYAYHVENKSLISDEALDSLKKELFDLEQEFPDLVTPDSPTQRVAGHPLEEFVKAQHEKPMLSLNDAFTEQDVKDWIERVENYLNKQIANPPTGQAGRKSLIMDFYCEPKLDGLAIELVYEDGVFVQGSTRGDGLIGEDVTQNLKTIEAIPLHLQLPITRYQLPKRFVVRGEVFLTKKEFERINRELQKKGEKVYANPRNLAAGTIRQLNPSITASRKLDSYAYSIVTDMGHETHEKEHEMLHALGFKTNLHTKRVESLEEVFTYRDAILKQREKLPYEIDGVVVIVNENFMFDAAGVIGKAPRAAIAYKFSPKEATTRVKVIVVQVGRTGVLTPVAVLEPVEVAGVTISHATLHNFDEIRRLDVRVGDTVIVSRAGDVIPKVLKVLTELRTGKEKTFHMPERCPVDGGKVIVEGAMYRCANPLCGARHKEQLYHFVSRGAFNIEGLGPKIIDRFLDEGLIADAADIFSVQKGDIETLERFGEKSAANLTNDIASRKVVTLPRFLFALGILHVGEETARVLAMQITNYQLPITSPLKVWKAFHALTKEQLQEFPDIGPKVAESIYDWFHEERNVALLRKLEKAGVEITIYSPYGRSPVGRHLPITQLPLSGKSFVITGTLESMSREEAKEKIRALGGEVNESVSKKTSYVVVGADPGSKAEKAKKLGVEILNEQEFLKVLQS